MSTKHEKRITARAILENNHLFSGLPTLSLDQIAKIVHLRSFAKGSWLFSQDEPGDAFFGIVSGRVRISVSAADGQELHIIELGPGDTFGEIALIDGGPRTATASVVADATLFTIERPRFLTLLHEQPSMMFHLLSRLCQRVRWTSELAEDLSFLEIPAQIAKRIALLAASFGTQSADGIELTIAQGDLAAFLSLSRQAVNMHLQSWRREGWIEIGRSRILVKDFARLESLYLDGR
jgi:CRP/FNR family cyclic AMP-dependent transcriptional regulator